MIPGSASPLLLKSAAAAAAPVQIERSLRFNSSDSGFLSRTPAVAGNRRTWTWAGWVKRSGLGSLQLLFGSNTLWFELQFNSSNQLQIYWETSGTGSNFLISNAVYRDVSAWMHIAWQVDTTQATSTNRIKVHVNGTEISWASASYPAPNYDTGVNATNAHGIGSRVTESNFYLSAYLADIHFIDGQALTPSSFTEVSATTGRIEAKLYAGSFGTNGFWLPFSSNSTAAALGTDYSGNSNTWTVNNLSVTAGAGNDSLVDTPTSYGTDTSGVGGEVRGNYATFNALALNGNSLSNGNLDYLAGSANKPTLATIGIPNTGKWYFEFTDVNSTGSFTAGVGSALFGASSYLGADANGWGYQTHPSNAGYHNSGVFTTTGRINGAGSNTILGVAIDRDAQKIWFSVNGTYVNSGVPSSGTNAQYSNLPSSGELFPGASTGSSQNIVFNAGQRAFAYTAPSGFKALCDTNLPEGTITTSGSYTGNGVADGPFVYLNGVPTAMTVGGNAVTFGTHADKLSNGFKLRTTSTTYNQNALSYNYSITTTGEKFKFARAQPNP